MSGLDRRRAGGAVLALCVALLFFGGPLAVDAQNLSIEVPLTTVVRASEGSEHLLAIQDVPEELRGVSCRTRAVAENQSSVHPGNDLVVASGDQRLVLENVEREPGAETVAEGSMLVGEQLTVTLVMGPDGVFSAGMTVRVVCGPASTTTTTEATTTSDTTTTTEGEQTTTTSADTTTTATVLETTLTTSTTTSTTSAPPTTAEDTTTTTDQPVATTDTTLPFTGVGGGPIAWAAAVALAVGIGLVAVTRRRGHTVTPGGGPAYREVEIEGIRIRLLRPGG